MRAVIQRVVNASVSVHGIVQSEIQEGFLVLLGVDKYDDLEDAKWLAKKIVKLRIFSDSKGIMNKSISDIKGDIIVVSQFTLHAKTKKGNRPSYTQSAKGDKAILLYNKFLGFLELEFGKKIQKGVFGSDMKVNICNNGPVTIIIDTKNKE